jgi:hypothetical protein
VEDACDGAHDSEGGAAPDNEGAVPGGASYAQIPTIKTNTRDREIERRRSFTVKTTPSKPAVWSPLRRPRLDQHSPGQHGLRVLRARRPSSFALDETRALRSPSTAAASKADRKPAR